MALPSRYWDGDHVVYNPLSGNTHILDIVTGEVLKTIAARRVCGADLCRHIANFLEVPNDPDLSEQVERILVALDGLGLIEPASVC